MPTKVFYNGIQVTGEPFVSRSIQPIDMGNRWGMTETITLNGIVSGVYRPLVGYPDQSEVVGQSAETGPTGLAHFITDIFKINFKPLQVKEGNTVYYDWPSAVVDSIDFEESKWSVGAPVKYTVKLKAHDLFHTNGNQIHVLNPSDNYSFTEGEDGSVTVTHKVSAKGIKTGSTSPFAQAQAFVDQYVGVDHFEATWLGNPYFITNRKPTLLSKSENVNRLEGTYSVTENYKYYQDSSLSCSQCESNAWQSDAENFSNEDECRAYYGCSLSTPHLKSVQISQSRSTSDEFNAISYDVSYKAGQDDSNAIANLRTIVNTETKASHRTYEKDIAQELLGSSAYHGWVYQVSLSLQENDAENTITVKAAYQTGTQFSNPYFDFKVDFSKDEITDISSYSINGDLKSYGSRGTKKKLLKEFKDLNYNTIETYLYNKVSSSQVFKTFGNEACANCDNGEWEDNGYANVAACRVAENCTNRVINPYPKSLKWSENPDRATLNLTAQFSDADYLANAANAKYSVAVTSSKEVFKELPSANVDGVFALQDLNCSTATNTKITVNGDAPHKGPHTSTYDSSFKTADMLALETLKSLKTTVATKIVPDDPKYYDDGTKYSYVKQKTDDSDDTQFPYTFSLNEGYLHTPTTEQGLVSSPFFFGNGKMGFASVLKGYQRPKHFKFGY
jgi:hypothetical protein